jgi:hypothetical protein
MNMYDPFFVKTLGVNQEVREKVDGSKERGRIDRNENEDSEVWN